MTSWFRNKTQVPPRSLHTLAHSGIVLAVSYPDVIAPSFLTPPSVGGEHAEAGVFAPLLLTFQNEPDCLYEGQGAIPFRGQERAKEWISLEIDSLDIVIPRLGLLLVGGAGTGKTSLAHIVTRLIQERRATTGLPVGAYFELMPAQINDPGKRDEFMQVMVRDPYSTVFIDEAHDLTDIDRFLRVLQDGGDPWFPLTSGQRLPVPKTVSWIFATTMPGKFDAALRRRLQEIPMEDPNEDVLTQIILDAGKQGIRQVTEVAARRMAQRALYPWQAKEVLYATAAKIAVQTNAPLIDLPEAERAFQLRGVDERGLLHEDRAVIKALLQVNGGRGITLASDPRTTLYRLSLENLCGAANVDLATYRTRIQPKLIRLGLLITRGGQCLTDEAVRLYGHLRTSV